MEVRVWDKDTVYPARDRAGVILRHWDPKAGYRYLVIQEQSSKLFGFVKGTIHDHETEMNAAKRELAEEVGLNVDVVDLMRAPKLTVVSHSSNDVCEYTFYLLLVDKLLVCDIDPVEVLCYEWMTLNTLYSLKRAVFTTKILPRLREWERKGMLPLQPLPVWKERSVVKVS